MIARVYVSYTRLSVPPKGEFSLFSLNGDISILCQRRYKVIMDGGRTGSMLTRKKGGIIVYSRRLWRCLGIDGEGPLDKDLRFQIGGHAIEAPPVVSILERLTAKVNRHIWGLYHPEEARIAPQS